MMMRTRVLAAVGAAVAVAVAAFASTAASQNARPAADDPNDADLWWDAGDHRFINAFYDADRNQLFTAHTVFRDFQPDTVTGAYPEAAVRWYEIDPAAMLKNTVVARRGIVGAPEVDVGWPTVATDSTG